MNPFPIPKNILENIFLQSEREYPGECCGMILGPANRPGVLSRLRPCRNVQDEYHDKDPQNFPRTSRTAYFIDPKELLAIQKEARHLNEEIRVIYHSHTDAGAYFSDEDARIALVEGEPAYPGVVYLVVSVQQGRKKEANLFSWNPKERRFK